MSETNESQNSNIINDFIKVAVFFNGLDKRFIQYKLETENDSARNMYTVPVNVEQVYSVANRY